MGGCISSCLNGIRSAGPEQTQNVTNPQLTANEGVTSDPILRNRHSQAPLRSLTRNSAVGDSQEIGANYEGIALTMALQNEVDGSRSGANFLATASIFTASQSAFAVLDDGSVASGAGSLATPSSVSDGGSNLGSSGSAATFDYGPPSGNSGSASIASASDHSSHSSSADSLDSFTTLDHGSHLGSSDSFTTASTTSTSLTFTTSD